MFTILKIAVALIIFWCGVQFGEVKANFHHWSGGWNAPERGYGRWHPYGMMEMMGGYGTPDVFYVSDNIAPEVAPSTKPASTR